MHSRMMEVSYTKQVLSAVGLLLYMFACQTQIPQCFGLNTIYRNMTSISSTVEYNENSGTYDIQVDTPFNVTCTYSNVDTSLGAGEVTWKGGRPDRLETIFSKHGRTRSGFNVHPERVNAGSPPNGSLVLIEDKVPYSYYQDSNNSKVAYKCQLLTVSETAVIGVYDQIEITATLELSVAVPVQILNITASSTVNEGENVELNCVTSGQPKAHIEWSRTDGKVLSAALGGGIKHRSLDGKLMLSNITAGDAAAYICAASNRVTSPAVTRSVTITVLHKPIVSAHTLSVNEMLENEVELRCTAAQSNPVLSSVGWYYKPSSEGSNNSGNVLISSGNDTSRYSYTNSTDENMFVETSLIIDAVAVADYERLFCCVYTNNIGTSETCISVKNPLQILSITASSTVNEGENVELDCVTREPSKAHIEWSRTDGKVLPSSLGGGLEHRSLDGKLMLSNITAGDAATYICEVSNGVTSPVYNRSVTITVLHKPIVLANMPSVNQRLGYQAELRCTAAQSNPVLNDVGWYYKPSSGGNKCDNVLISNGNDTSRYSYTNSTDENMSVETSVVIDTVTMKDYERLFCCVYTNNIGTSETCISVKNPLQILSITASSTVNEGENVELDCITREPSKAHIDWSRTDGKVLPAALGGGLKHRSLDGKLMLSNITPGDAATYICAVSNGVTSPVFNRSVTITVLHKPIVSAHKPSVNKMLGYQAELRCTAAQSNLALNNIGWYYKPSSTGSDNSDNVLISNGHATSRYSYTNYTDQNMCLETSLIIDGVTMADYERLFCCVYTNNIGTSETCISVKNPLQILSITANSTVNEGENVELDCVTSGLPKAHIEWSRTDGKVLPSSLGGELKHRSLDGKLMLSNITAGDAATYICAVSNGVTFHAVTRSVTITVLYKPVIVSARALSVNQRLGNQAELRCTAAQSNPILSSVGWYYKPSSAGSDNGENVLISHDDDTSRYSYTNSTDENMSVETSLVIDTVTMKDYERLFCCVYANNIGTSEECIFIKGSFASLDGAAELKLSYLALMLVLITVL